LAGLPRAGPPSLPLAPQYPAERLAFMLPDASVAPVVTQSALLERLPQAAAPGAAAARRVVRLDADWGAISRQPRQAPPRVPDPRHPAYVIYTSGSTGNPKAVVVEHASLANKMVALAKDFDVGSDFRSASVISSSFDASIEQILLPLIGGGTAVVISDDVRESPSQFWQDMDRSRVTFLSCVPSYLDSMLHQVPETLPLKHLALGGEALA